jgi:sugar phosphate isomerase/epimerase
LLQVHVNDNDGIEQQNLVPGDGVFDFPKLIELLRQSNFSGCLSAELAWGYCSNPEPPVSLAASRLRKLLAN